MIKELIIAATAFTATVDYSNDVKQFDNYISNNYHDLRTTAQNICWGDSEYEDILQETLIKVRNRISFKGFSGTTYESYQRNLYSFIWRGLSNSFNKKKLKDSKTKFHDFENEELQDQINDALELNNHDSQPYYDSMEDFTRALFKYLDKNYDEKKATLFKTYYMTNANTYKKLATQSGYRKKYIQDILSKMKKEVRLEFKRGKRVI